MDRCTKRLADGQAVMDCQGCPESWMNIPGSGCTALYCRDRLKDRVAAYEDTGLEPQEIERIVDAYGRGHTLRTESAERLEIIREIPTDRLRELVEADRDGRCVVLPCKIGTPVWVIGPECGKYFVRKAKFSMAKFDYLGETVFFSREDAEAKMHGGVQ